MYGETYWVGERIKLAHLLKEHPDWSVVRRCARALGHDAKWVRRWKARFLAAPNLTLESVCSRSHARKSPTPGVSADLKPLVFELRQTLSEQFHRKAGAKTILYGLQQRHAQQPLPFSLPTSPTTITKLLHALNCIQPPQPVTHEPLVLPPPNEEWELDFGEVWLAEDERLEFLLVVDRGTSRLIHVEGCRGYNAEMALEAIAEVLRQHGLPKRLRFDRDPRLWGAWTRDSYPSPLIRFLRVLRIEPVVCPPHRPDLKPVVERTIQTLKYEWLARFELPTVGAGLDALAQFPAYYNDTRPHQGRACQNRPPSVAFPQLPVLPQLPQQVDPDAWVKAIHARPYRRRVTSDGTIQIDRHTYSVGSAYAKQGVVVLVDAPSHQLRITLDGKLIRSLPLKGLLGEPAMDFEVYLVVMRTEARTVEAHRRLLWEQRGEVA